MPRLTFAWRSWAIPECGKFITGIRAAQSRALERAIAITAITVTVHFSVRRTTKWSQQASVV
jgi:hypothetical protein